MAVFYNREAVGLTLTSNKLNPSFTGLRGLRLYFCVSKKRAYRGVFFLGLVIRICIISHFGMRLVKTPGAAFKPSNPKPSNQ